MLAPVTDEERAVIALFLIAVVILAAAAGLALWGLWVLVSLIL